jgi:chromosome segregation ATPase
MPEFITPEMITIAIASLAALTFLLVLITIASLSRVKKRFSSIEIKSLELDEKHRLLEAADKITSFESKMDKLEELITESQNQLAGHESKLNDHAATFGKVSQMTDQHLAGFTKAADKITLIESRLDRLDNKISDNQNQLTGHDSKLNEHAAMFAKVSQMTGQHMAELSKATEKISSFESKLDGFDSKISEGLNQLTEHESKLNEHAAMFGKVSQMTVQHVAGLSEATEKIKSLESRLDGFNNRIAEGQNQLTKHETKLNDHNSLLGQTYQMMGKNAANLTRVIKQMDTLEEKYQELKEFKSDVEQTRSIILDALNVTQAKMFPKDILTTERAKFQEENRIPSEEELSDTENIDKSRMQLDM